MLGAVAVRVIKQGRCSGVYGGVFIFGRAREREDGSVGSFTKSAERVEKSAFHEMDSACTMSILSAGWFSGVEEGDLAAEFWIFLGRCCFCEFALNTDEATGA